MTVGAYTFTQNPGLASLTYTRLYWTIIQEHSYQRHGYLHQLPAHCYHLQLPAATSISATSLAEKTSSVKVVPLAPQLLSDLCPANVVRLV